MLSTKRDTLREFIEDIEPFFDGKKVIYVDVGAYQGHVFKSLLDSRLEIHEAHLFEPNPRSFAALAQMPAALLKNHALHVYPVALGAESGELCMQDAEKMTRVLSDQSPAVSVNALKVPCTTLDSLREVFTDRRISLLKIDVEGFEEQVLAGAYDLLSDQAVDVIYIETGANQTTNQQCYFTKIDAILTQHQYRLFRIYEQRHEWLEDLPILRRMNCCYFSERFAERHPYERTSRLRSSNEKGGTAARFLDSLAQVERLLQGIKRQIEADSLPEHKWQDDPVSQLEMANGEEAVTLTELQRKLRREKILNDFSRKALRSNARRRLWNPGFIGRIRAKRLIEKSSLFDRAWYVSLHPEAADDPIQHYLTEGVFRGFDPHPLFDSAWYVERKLNELDGLNPLAHYLRKGIRQKVQPHRLFDSTWYLNQYRAAVGDNRDALTHYLTEGARANFEPNSEFDSQWYREVAGLSPEINPLVHYVLEGRHKGLSMCDPGHSCFPQNESAPKPSSANKLASLRRKLLSFGFHRRGTEDLQMYVKQGRDVSLRRLAAFELAGFRAISDAEIDLRDCLSLLEVAQEDEYNEQKLRRIAILRSECLSRLGDKTSAKNVLLNLMQDNDAHPDPCLAMANLQTTTTERLAWINQCFRLHEMPEVSLRDTPDGSPYDRLTTVLDQQRIGIETEDIPKVSVIVPAYNSQHSIHVALDALLAQSWRNMEILVVDDGSSDATVDAIKHYAEKDPRVRLLVNPKNRGPYVARNLALQSASGEFVTCHDADDWSHPLKIARQATHLLTNSQVVANMSPQARAFEDLSFYRRGKLGIYVHPNMSSLMFRRRLVLETIGYWDSVRFAGDSEFLQRIKHVFGPKSVMSLKGAPLSFQKQSAASLTGDANFGYNGFKMGARLEYESGHDRFHKRSERPYIEFPLTKRPFAIPEPMRPEREVPRGQTRHFDVIIASDFRFPGGTTRSNLEELKVHTSMGLRTGLIHMWCYELDAFRLIHPDVGQKIDDGEVEPIVYGENVTCDLLLIRQPWVLQDHQAYVPRVSAKDIRVIINQPPRKNYLSKNQEMLYSISGCVANLQKYFGSSGTWHPIGPLVRKALVEHHANDLESVTLADENWVNIIDINEWRRQGRPERGQKIRLCRHSRDSYLKWPSTRDELLAVYPEIDRYEVHVLGGAEVPKKILNGTLPSNWCVLNYGQMAPQEFLARCDVFVYFPHSGWVESFGRVIIEAMSVGLPVFLPKQFEPLFRDAAIYAEPRDLLRMVDEIMADDTAYDEQVSRAIAFVEDNFDYSQHKRRLQRIICRT